MIDRKGEKSAPKHSSQRIFSIAAPQHEKIDASLKRFATY
jgi:hypothetical protein